MKLVITESQMHKIVRRLNESTKKDKIKKIQQFLVDKGFDLGDFGENEDGVDGDYGNLTKKAVEKFQREKGFKEEDIDGKVGPDTAKAMGVDIEPVFGKKSKESDEKEKDKKNVEKKDSDSSYLSVSSYGKLVLNSNKNAPLLVVYGGINVGGRTSGVYMWDYMDEIGRAHV